MTLFFSKAEVEREQAYFNVLEKKEMYEDKMKAVMELKVTAICCKTVSK